MSLSKQFMRERVPVGAILPNGGFIAALSGQWNTCAGQLLNISAYPELYAIIGTRFGGATGQFRLPNITSRVIVGLDRYPGGSAALRNTHAESQTVGGVGGSSTKTLAVGNIPNHNHSSVGVAHSHFWGPNTHTHSNPLGVLVNHGPVAGHPYADTYTATFFGQYAWAQTQTSSAYVHSGSAQLQWSSAHANPSVSATGGGAPLDNNQPYYRYPYVIRVR